MTEDESQVREICRAHGEAMKAMDRPALEALWDTGYEHLVYQPEEYERACRSFNEITDYWGYIPGAVETISQWRELDTDIAVLGDAAIVYSLVMTTFQLKGVDEPLEGEVRFTFGLRRTSAGWRMIHCHESRQLVIDDH